MISILSDWIGRRIQQRLGPFDLVEHVANVTDVVEIGSHNYVIRPFISSDMNSILSLAERAYIDEMAPLTKSQLNQNLIDTMKRSADLVSSAFTIIVEKRICGFVRYACWTNILHQEKILENLFIYIEPEYRSFSLFRRLGCLLERAGRDIGADKVLLSFQNGIAPETKRLASERIGFRRAGAFLGKPLEPSTKSKAIKSNFPFKAIYYIKKKSRLDSLDFFIYMIGSALHIRGQMRRGNVFLELGVSHDSFLFARTMTRVIDNCKQAVVTIINKPTSEMMNKLSSWAVQHKCTEILINTKEVEDDPCLTFPDYEKYGFLVLGYILSKSVSGKE